MRFEITHTVFSKKEIKILFKNGEVVVVDILRKK